MSHQIIITGKEKYINYLFRHLREEHPSTRTRMKMRKKR